MPIRRTRSYECLPIANKRFHYISDSEEEETQCDESAPISLSPTSPVKVPLFGSPLDITPLSLSDARTSPLHVPTAPVKAVPPVKCHTCNMVPYNKTTHLCKHCGNWNCLACMFTELDHRMYNFRPLEGYSEQFVNACCNCIEDINSLYSQLK